MKPSTDKQKLFERLQAELDARDRRLDAGAKLEENPLPAEYKDEALFREFREWQHQRFMVKVRRARAHERKLLASREK